MFGRDEQLGRGPDEPESRQETARRMAGDAEPGEASPESEERPQGEPQAEADLLEATGGDPLTQESG